MNFVTKDRLRLNLLIYRKVSSRIQFHIIERYNYDDFEITGNIATRCKKKYFLTSWLTEFGHVPTCVKKTQSEPL